MVTYKNETHSVAEWADILGVKYVTLLSRLDRNDWDTVRAFEEPVEIRTKDPTNTLNKHDVYEYNGEQKTASEWARELGIPIGTIYSRLRQGYPIEKALEKREFKFRYLTYNGETKMLSEWAKQYGLIPQTLRDRLNRGWDLERALTT